MRDYFIKEKRRDEHIKKEGLSPKVRRTSYFEMLNFLSAPKVSSQKSCKRKVHLPKSESGDVNSLNDSYPMSSPNAQEDSSSDTIHTSAEPSSLRYKTPTTVSYPQNVIKTMEHKYPINADDDSDMHFLHSLLPLMRSMNENENFDFRLEVMKLIKTIKFQTNCTKSNVFD